MAAVPDVHIVYWVTRHVPDQHLSTARAGLSADEQARAAQFAFADHRRDFIAAHGPAPADIIRTCAARQV